MAGTAGADGTSDCSGGSGSVGTPRSRSDHSAGANQKRMTELIQQSPAAPLLEMVGAGAVTVATVLTAWSHPGRVRSEAAFAALAGVNPLPASSGNTVRHRLNRGGDRRLNRALHTITMTR